MQQPAQHYETLVPDYAEASVVWFVRFDNFGLMSLARPSTAQDAIETRVRNGEPYNSVRRSREVPRDGWSKGGHYLCWVRAITPEHAGARAVRIYNKARTTQ